jgi:glucose/arabinose dehydrogenase
VAANHNGGRLKFGPDGFLYVTTGDAANGELAQDRDSLAGKTLRIVADGSSADGSPAPENPFDTAVWSWGHRNVQGIAWVEDGRMYASEFGQGDVDELNLLVAGANYGWPTVEGLDRSPSGTQLGDTVDGLTYPVAEWRPTSSASPSGIAATREAIYIAGLRGEALFRVPLTASGVGAPEKLIDDVGRVRDVLVGPDGALYIATNNTDGRGTPRTGDDRIVRIEIAPAN